MRNLQHIIFYVKTKIFVDVKICISVPLRNREIPDLYFSNKTRFDLKSVNGI